MKNNELKSKEFLSSQDKKQTSIKEYLGKDGIKYIFEHIRSLNNLYKIIDNLNIENRYDEINDSVSEGWNSKEPINFAYGTRSHAEGIGTRTQNRAEHACGLFNKTNENTLYSIGTGTSRTERKNAVEVTQDGAVFIEGIGGYNGTNTQDSKSVQQVILDLSKRIEVLENC